MLSASSPGGEGDLADHPTLGASAECLKSDGTTLGLKDLLRVRDRAWCELEILHELGTLTPGWPFPGRAIALDAS